MILALAILGGAMLGAVLFLFILGACASGANEDRERAELIARDHGRPRGNVDLLPRL